MPRGALAQRDVMQQDAISIYIEMHSSFDVLTRHFRPLCEAQFQEN
ncbi:hypothetical protein SAMN02787076_04939 [Rhizobacter sp. OV335]|nr:hypothetical protein SAMN02787076_04939 [Rhizobacter sp. OV335]